MAINNKKENTSNKHRPRRSDNKFLISKFKDFTLTEAYNSARTNLMFTLSTKKRKTVVITSGSPSEGKSASSVNMAITIAKTGARVLLIDADLRKPTVQTMLRIKNKEGFSTLIGKFCTVEQAVNVDVIENLDVICSGPIPPNPAELLSSPFVEELMAFFQEKYDFVILDTPPVGLVTDALLMNNIISGILFVVREGYTTHTELKEAINTIKLANGKILGILKVDCQGDNLFKGKNKRKYGEYYKKYGYGYGYGYGDYDYGNKKKKEKNDDDIEIMSPGQIPSLNLDETGTEKNGKKNKKDKKGKEKQPMLINRYQTGFKSDNLQNPEQFGDTNQFVSPAESPNPSQKMGKFSHTNINSRDDSNQNHS